MEPFERMLMGGHPNSLGRTLEVVDIIRANPAELEQLYQCYFSSDEVVRLRVSNAFKRISREHPDWLLPYIDRFIAEIARIDQASTRWTLAQIFHELDGLLTPQQRAGAIAVVQRNLTESDDWIVVNQSLTALGHWARSDATVKAWLLPHLERFLADPRKSVVGTASKVSRMLAGKNA
ncbi:MAG: hypothetical protein KME04_13630 [Pleurocapsa minor GSE-CHR-MK-17-07R]|jgi:hypothetical protein|nr:hypothetical protein [Pleurocapsa minor GSE-CHR-MK 17-07R]